MSTKVFEPQRRDFFEVLNTRKTIRKYTLDNPPIEAIKIIADAGRQAPCATNTQNWEFIAVLDDRVKEKMARAVEQKYDELQQKVDNDIDKAKLNGYKYYSMFFTKAPVVFAVVEKQRISTILTILEKNGMTKAELDNYDTRSSILSMGAAIENMSLTAHALGLATCWMCAPVVAHKEFGEILGVKEPDKVVTLLTVGYPDGDNFSRPPKKELDEVFRIV